MEKMIKAHNANTTETFFKKCLILRYYQLSHSARPSVIIESELGLSSRWHSSQAPSSK